jgi:2-dehydropantoate 2-reductase
MKKICIYGAGAVGGFIGVLLARSGRELNVVARGDTLGALQNNGLRLQAADDVIVQQVHATDDPKVFGEQDLVILAVKGPALGQVAQKIAPLIGPSTTVLTTMNGVPWWFFDGFGGPHANLRLESVDPDGSIAEAIPTCHVVGGVVHGSFAVSEPGFVRHHFGKRLIIGEPGGGISERLQALASLLTQAGMDIVLSETIQKDIWFKLWGNMTMNPVSAITGATCDRILDDPLVNRFCLDVMAEASRIGEKIGCPITQSGEERNALTRELGAFKTSMLQDVEGGRAVEIDSLVGAVREIGQKVGEKTPNMDILLGIARLHARVRGLYPDIPGRG